MNKEQLFFLYNNNNNNKNKTKTTSLSNRHHVSGSIPTALAGLEAALNLMFPL